MNKLLQTPGAKAQKEHEAHKILPPAHLLNTPVLTKKEV